MLDSDDFKKRRRSSVDTRGEKLLFYPQMTLMTQIFLGCVVRGNQPHSGRNAKSAKIMAN